MKEKNFVLFKPVINSKAIFVALILLLLIYIIFIVHAFTKQAQV